MLTSVVTRDPLCPGAISPLLCGQFVEYLCDLVPAIWAERLCDGSFEGLTPYKVAFLAQTDFRERPWYPSGAVNRAEYALDPVVRVSGEVSQRIHVIGTAPCTVGISQEGIFFEKGVPCVFRVWLRSENLGSEVRVRLHRDGKSVASCKFQPDDAWRSYTAALSPGGGATAGALTIEFDGPGTLWIDNASLMPRNTLGGWRPDVVEALQALRPGVIRFGGSALDDCALGDYNWRENVGRPECRSPLRAWGGLQPAEAGLEEIVQLCKLVGAQPLICVRFSGSTPLDAADEVEYFNGAADTPMGAMRAANGHSEPYGICLWQVGNEVSGPDYEAGLAGFCKAMRAVDPTIKILSSYPAPGVLRAAADWLDYVCPHQYDCANLAACERELEETDRMIRASGSPRRIRVAITEWNTTACNWGPGRAALWTLANALACSRYHNMLCRHADLVEIANRSNLANSFCSGILQTDHRRLYKTPTFYAQQLYGELAGAQPLRIDFDHTQNGRSGGIGCSGVDASGNDGLDVCAARSADGAAVRIFVVNDSLQSISRCFDLSAFGTDLKDVQVTTLSDRTHSGSPDVTNSFDDPERVAPFVSTVHGRTTRLAYRFSPLSLTTLEWRIPAAA